MRAPERWRFGPFEADTTERQLRRGGQVVPVTQKAFALLEVLLARRGKLVSKAELFDSVWAGRIVTDAALSRVIRELRVALGDQADEPRYIATAHGLGFRFVADVEAHGDPASSPASASPPSPETAAAFGRAAEIALLRQALAAAHDGQRQVVFVTGEAGIGKTTLVEAFLAQHAPHAAFHTAQGRCIEQYGTGEAYLPVLEALEGLARQVGNDALRAVLLRYAPAWLAQLPWLAHDADPAAMQRALSGVTAKGMLRDIAQALEVLSAERPIVLWLEDLHWSDYSTLDVISVLAGRRDRARLLVVGSYRPSEAQGSDSPLGRLVQGLRQRGQAAEIALGLLDVATVGAYLRARLPDPAPGLPLDAMAAAIHARTDGNGLFTVAVVDTWIREGRLVRTDEGWMLTCALSELGGFVPDSLRQLVQAQIGRLAEENRRVVEAAAVAGTDFCAASLAAALQCSVADAEERCLSLAKSGRFLRQREPVQWPDGTESSGFQFEHALYWQGAYEHAAQARRAEWQRLIGECEEAAYGAQRNLIAAGLAMRFEAARDFDRAVRYLELAGAGALARCAYKECADLLRRASTLVERLPADTQAKRRLALLLPLGAALMAVQGYASDEVEATYRQALALCRDVGKPGQVERVLRGLWNVALVRADLAQARVLADEMIVRAAASGSVGTTFDALAKAGQTSMHRGEFTSARSQLERTLAQPPAGEDAARQRELPRVLAYLAWVLWYTGHPQQARLRAEEALALARAAGSVHTTAFVLGFAGWLHVFCGRMESTRELAREQMQLAVEHELAYWRIWSDCLQGLVAARTGDFDPGLRRMHAAIADFEAMGARVGVSHFLCQLAEAELLAGRTAAARATIARSAMLLERHGNAYHAADTARIRGLVAAAEGDRAAATTHLHAAMDLARRQDARSLRLRAATSLAQLAMDQGDQVAASRLLAPLHAGFAEGHDTADLENARGLLARLRVGPGVS